MANIITIVLLCLFATYGLISLLKEAAASFRDRIAEENDRLKLALVVKDCEQDVEWVVRRVMNCRLPAGSGCPYRLTVIDMDSSDETPIILNRLSREYPGMELLNAGDRYHLFDSDY